MPPVWRLYLGFALIFLTGAVAGASIILITLACRALGPAIRRGGEEGVL